MTIREDLEARIGENIGVGEWHTVTQEAIDQFADATSDHQWIHVDPERAAKGPFGTTIAHGFMTLALIAGISPSLEVPGVKLALNYGLDRVRFISPVPSGSRVRVSTVLAEVAEVAGGLQLKNTVTVELEGSEKPACVAEALVRVHPVDVENRSTPIVG